MDASGGVGVAVSNNTCKRAIQQIWRESKHSRQKWTGLEVGVKLTTTQLTLSGFFLFWAVNTTLNPCFFSGDEIVCSCNGYFWRDAPLLSLSSFTLLEQLRCYRLLSLIWLQKFCHRVEFIALSSFFSVSSGVWVFSEGREWGDVKSSPKTIIIPTWY